MFLGFRILLRQKTPQPWLESGFLSKNVSRHFTGLYLTAYTETLCPPYLPSEARSLVTVRIGSLQVSGWRVGHWNLLRSLKLRKALNEWWTLCLSLQHAICLPLGKATERTLDKGRPKFRGWGSPGTWWSKGSYIVAVKKVGPRGQSTAWTPSQSIVPVSKTTQG